MKKSSLLVVVPTIVLCTLLVSGCGLFHSKKAWETAQQESPLEIPPGLDRPSTSEALVIPPPGADASGAGRERGMAAERGPVSDGFVLTDAVDAAYTRVGEALKTADLGTITHQDDATHTYTVDVKGVVAQQRKRGFFSRIFRRDRKGGAANAGHEVSVAISESGTGSEVRVQGGAAAVGKLVDGLKSHLGS